MGGVRFLLDGEVIETGDIDPTETLLDFLRYRLRKTGTKEGCAEGDCGACTVLIGELAGEAIQWRAINSCIMFMPMIDGQALLTVESLGNERSPNPVQRAMVDCHASQCGFCTPGFVMSLEGRRIGALGTEETPLGDVLAGNLCRCTGYGPILAAGACAVREPRDDSALAAALHPLARTEALSLEWNDQIGGAHRRWISPRSLDEFAECYARDPSARIIAGGTDVGLMVTKQQRVLESVIWLGKVEELRTIEESDNGVRFGASVRYSEAFGAIARLHPELARLVRRIGGLQVRNAGTIGGNIANGSPIGDMPPALIALGATVTLRRLGERRTIPLEDYFLAYGKQDRAPGEFVESIFVPRPATSVLVSIKKLSKRFDSDISAVCGAMVLMLDGGRVAEARIAFGGMAGTPARAVNAENAFIGEPLNLSTFERAAAALAEDFTPLTDVRGSARYRLEAASNFIRQASLSDHVSLAGLEPIDG